MTSPQDRARDLANTAARYESQESTIEITKPPSKALPIPFEPAFEEDEEDEG